MLYFYFKSPSKSLPLRNIYDLFHGIKVVKVQNKTTSKTKIKSEGKSIFKCHHHFTVDLNLTKMAATQNTLPQTHSSSL